MRNRVITLSLLVLAAVAGWFGMPVISHARADYWSTVFSTPVLCANPTHKDTNVGTIVGNCPATQFNQRRFVTFCNSNENSGSPTIKIRIDGVAPVTGLGNPGDVLAVGSCVTYNIASGVVPQCIASASSTHLTSLECQ